MPGVAATSDSFRLPPVRADKARLEGSTVHTVVAEIGRGSPDLVARLLDHLEDVQVEGVVRLLASVAGGADVLEWLAGLDDAALAAALERLLVPPEEGASLARVSPAAAKANRERLFRQAAQETVSPVYGEQDPLLVLGRLLEAGRLGRLRARLKSVADHRRPRDGTHERLRVLAVHRALAEKVDAATKYAARADAFRDARKEATHRVLELFVLWQRDEPRIAEHKKDAWDPFLRALRNGLELAVEREGGFYEHERVEDVARAFRTLIEQGYQLWVAICRKLGLAERFSKSNAGQNGGCGLGAATAFRMRDPPRGTIEHTVKPALEPGLGELSRLQRFIDENRVRWSNWLNGTTHGTGIGLDHAWPQQDLDAYARACQELIPAAGRKGGQDFVTGLFVPVALRLYARARAA